ncbi:hypothetical protein D915_010607 [Fasciola hepatica]|uniref:Cadherin domain protein n=1 Tax=Fasciola hepatica TaxID=6192 RepID=A0A4E0QUA5_FASHE|nr:hypothetical protein D915_010607 [Fasciola hepatica]
MIHDLLKLAVLLQVAIPGANPLSFSKPLYVFTVHHESKVNKDEIGRVELSNQSSKSEVRFWLEDNASEKNGITIDKNSGTLHLKTSPAPTSFEVTVHAAIGEDFKGTQTKALVRVHVICFYRSQLWDVVRGWTSLYLVAISAFTYFNLWEVDNYLLKVGELIRTPRNVVVRYQMCLTKWGCIPQARVNCNVTKNIQINIVTSLEAGTGMKCMDHSLQNKFTEVKENSVTINIGDICATGNDDSWC